MQAVGQWQIRMASQFGFLKSVEPLDPFMASRSMASQFIPYIDAYVDAGGKFARSELGLQDADDWLVKNPYAVESARQAAFDLCDETVANFTEALGGQIQILRDEVAESIARGETTGDTVDRISKWMNDESRWRARRIAVTESARAFNHGQIASTIELDFIAGYKLVLSSDACPICHAIHRQCPMVPKGGTFGQHGSNSTYKRLSMPPFHPGCRCTIVVVFDDEAPDTWPQPVQPGANGYVQPSKQDYEASEEGGYESVSIGNAKSSTGYVVIWGEGEYV